MPSFRELADVLPQVDPGVPVADLPDGISRPAEPDSAFIEPTLTLIEGDIATATIILAAAPAAVGKSTFAQAIASDRGALLWDIGEFAVGSGTFLGKLTESHGIAGLAKVTGDLSTGRYGLILDALDEGYSLAGGDNFEAFVTDLAKQVAQLGPPGPTIIACGRTDTVELTNLLLSETGVATCVVSIDFFTLDGAREFVDIRLGQLEHTAHRRFRTAFEQARDALFERVAIAVGSDDEVSGMDASSFLGYAPVLIALARYLEVDNYQALAQDLTKGAPDAMEDRENVWTFLRGIVDDLLQREQPKLVDKLPAHVRAAIPADRLDDLYSPEEQCARLLARVGGVAAPTVDLPAVVLPEYEKSVNETLGEHPFVGAGPLGFASVVFRDYVLGQAIALGSEASLARGLVRGRAYKASPLLLRFFVEFKGEHASPIDIEDLDILYASALAEEVGDARVSLTITQAVDGLNAEIVTALGDFLEFNVAEPEVRELVLGGRLARAELSVPDWTVILGRTGTEALIGPDVTIECDRLVVAAASMRVEARNAEEAVTWQANRVVHEAAEFKLSGADRQGLRLTVGEQPVYPWTSFVSTDEITRDDHEPAFEDALRELKQLSAWFKPGPVRGGAPTLPVRIMKVLVARERVSPDMYYYAVDTGLVTLAGKVCSLHPQQFGMNIVDLKARRLTPPIREYLAGYIRARRP